MVGGGRAGDEPVKGGAGGGGGRQSYGSGNGEQLGWLNRGNGYRYGGWGVAGGECSGRLVGGM